MESAVISGPVGGDLTVRGEQWVAWVHFAPNPEIGRWPVAIVDAAIRKGGVGAAFIVLHQLYGCAMLRDAGGDAAFYIL
jgi:hypothetical protein